MCPSKTYTLQYVFATSQRDSCRSTAVRVPRDLQPHDMCYNHGRGTSRAAVRFSLPRVWTRIRSAGASAGGAAMSGVPLGGPRAPALAVRHELRRSAPEIGRGIARAADSRAEGSTGG